MTPTAQQAQAAFILCERDRTIIDPLIGELERQLTDQAATILHDGVSPKRDEGFIVVEAARGIPDGVVQWLQNEPCIKECVVYDVPSVQQEHQVEEQARRTAVAEIAPIVRALRQILQSQVGGETADDRNLMQSALRTTRSALHCVTTALTREKAAWNAVTKAWNQSVRESTDSQDTHFHTLLWIDDACEAAIQELFQIAALWEKIGDDMVACGDRSGHLIAYQCLQQRRRMIQRALDIMSWQLEAHGEQGRLNQDARGGIMHAELPEAIAFEQHQAQEEAEEKEGQS